LLSNNRQQSEREKKKTDSLIFSCRLLLLVELPQERENRRCTTQASRQVDAKEAGDGARNKHALWKQRRWERRQDYKGVVDRRETEHYRSIMYQISDSKT